MTKTKTDSNQVSIHQHQDYTVKWHQIQNSKQKWIVIKWPFLVEINGHGNICNKLGVVGKGLIRFKQIANKSFERKDDQSTRDSQRNHAHKFMCMCNQ